MTAPALSEFELLVQQIIIATSCSREKAEAAARMNRPDLATPHQVLQSVDNVREKEEQAYIAKLFRGFGCKVYWLSQARSTKQTEGLPDLWVVHVDAKLAFWFETKRSSGGRVRPEQKLFADECEATGVKHHMGDRRVAARILLDAGLARVGEGPCGIVPFHEGR